MSCLCELIQHADWKTEKHVPVIDAPEVVKAGENIKVSVCVGKEVAHPNKTEHHISWIEVYFKPADSKFPIQIGRTELAAHGASGDGPDTSGIYSSPCVSTTFKTNTPGSIIAMSYCNIHGLWESCKQLGVE